MVEVFSQYEKQTGCVHDYPGEECRAPGNGTIVVGAGDNSDHGRVICDRMWPETCYVCDNGDRFPSGCREVPQDPCKRSPIDPGHDILPKECGEKGRQPRPIFDGEGKQKAPQKKTGSYVPSGDFYSSAGSFDRFSESYEGYLEEGDGLALVVEGDKDSDRDKPEKPEREKPERPERDTTQERVQELRDEAVKLDKSSTQKLYEGPRDIGDGHVGTGVYKIVESGIESATAIKKLYEADKLEKAQEDKQKPKKVGTKR